MMVYASMEREHHPRVRGVVHVKLFAQHRRGDGQGLPVLPTQHVPMEYIVLDSGAVSYKLWGRLLACRGLQPADALNLGNRDAGTHYWPADYGLHAY